MSSSAKHDRVAAKYESETSRYMTINGSRIHYCVEGRGPTLLLLHGVMSSLHTWQGWVRALAGSYRIVRIDLPGFGLSDHLASHDYTPEHAVELIEQIRTQLHLEHFHLVGNSLGGFLSWYYAAHHPERVDKLILIDPIGYPQKLPPMIALLSLPLVGSVARLFSPRFLVARHVREMYGNRELVSEELIDRYHQLLARGNNRTAMLKTFKRLRRYKDDAELCRLIPRVRVPTLLMWGEQDRWVPPSLIAAWRRDLPSAQVLTYAGAGHMPMEELPELTARDAHAFLSAGAHTNLEEPQSAPAQVVPFVFSRGA